MDVPVALAIGIAWTASIAALFTGAAADGDHVYFDSVAMFVFLLLLGRHFELGIRHRFARSDRSLGDLLPALARRRGDDGGWSRGTDGLPRTRRPHPRPCRRVHSGRRPHPERTRSSGSRRPHRRERARGHRAGQRRGRGHPQSRCRDRAGSHPGCRRQRRRRDSGLLRRARSGRAGPCTWPTGSPRCS
ncbi:MAG: hypothetical protein U5R48_11555 [Gammaproteobacteria bacterium]|nr:hypothetical protein [Gammaproteobacteria bacterium]